MSDRTRRRGNAGVVWVVMECGYDVIVVVLTVHCAHRYTSNEIQVHPNGRRLSLPQVLVRDGILYFWLASI